MNVDFSRSGLAYDPTSQSLYATGLDNNFYKINTSTGAAELIGPVGGYFNIMGLTFDESEGILYGVSGTPDAFYTIDPSTGTATLIGPLGIDAGTGISLAGG